MKNNLLELTKESKEALVKKITSKVFEDIIAKTKAASAEDTGTFKVIISTENLDRQGDTLSMDQFDLTNYLKNPVVLWGHDYYNMPIGATDKISIEGYKMVAEGRFAPTEEGQNIRKYYEASFPIGLSVGFMPSAYDEKTGEISKYELLEYSFVSVPANQECVPLHQARSLGLDIAFLTAKGLKFEDAKKKDSEQTAEEGDDCTMGDGTPGTMSNQDGEMVCIPKESKAKKGEDKPEDTTNPDKGKLDQFLRENLKSLHDSHTVNIKGIAMKCEKAIQDYDEEKGLDEFKAKAIEEFKTMHKAMDGEHKDHQEKCMKAIEEYMKAIEDYTKGLTDYLKSISDFTEKAHGAIKEILSGAGANSKDEKNLQKVDTQKEVVDSKAIDSLIKLRSVLREKVTEYSETLGQVNKTIKEITK
jgi:hypothetical protein